jgi:hypothetical protein
MQLPAPSFALYVPARQLAHVVAPFTAFHVPALHFMQTIEPDAWYVPAVQFVQALSPDKLYVPVMQFIQVLSDCAPTSSLYVPAMQCVQGLTPAVLQVPAVQFVQALAPDVLYVPAVHSMQLSDPVALYVPAMHSVQMLTPAALYVPAEQFVQAEEPVADFQVPAPQGVHAVPSAPVYPARQVQIELSSIEKVLSGHTVQFGATADEYVFASQGMHVPAPVVFLYVPAVHDVHATEPVMVLYVPVSQAVHAVPSTPMYPARHVQIELPSTEKVLLGHGIQLVAASDE